MITKNFEDFPEHRSNLFNLLRAINHHCFPALLQGADNFTLIIESIKCPPRPARPPRPAFRPTAADPLPPRRRWAFKHTERTVAETGLHTLLELLQNVQASTVMNAFYVQYYLGLLQDVFAVLTDTLHKPGFKLQAMILARAPPSSPFIPLAPRRRQRGRADPHPAPRRRTSLSPSSRAPSPRRSGRRTAPSRRRQTASTCASCCCRCSPPRFQT